MKHSGETISGGTSRNMSEGGYGNAGEHPERLRSGEESDVLPFLRSTHSQSTGVSAAKGKFMLERSSPVSLSPEAKNSRPQGGTAAECEPSKCSGVVQLRMFGDLPELISKPRERVSEMVSLSGEVRDKDISYEIPDFMKVRYPR